MFGVNLHPLNLGIWAYRLRAPGENSTLELSSGSGEEPPLPVPRQGALTRRGK